MKGRILVLLVLMTCAAPALAQEHELVLRSEFEQRLDDVTKWLSEYHAWEKWYESWGNKVDTQLIGERQKRPEPPVWLGTECQEHVTFNGPLALACDILRDWDEEPLRILQ